jgi:hypothetical protein
LAGSGLAGLLAFARGASLVMLFLSASMRSTTFSPRGRALAAIVLPLRFALMSSVSASFFELLRIEVGRLLADDMLRQIEHVVGDFHILDLVEIFLLIPDFIGVSQERAHEAFVEGRAGPGNLHRTLNGVSA